MVQQGQLNPEGRKGHDPWVVGADSRGRQLRLIAQINFSQCRPILEWLAQKLECPPLVA